MDASRSNSAGKSFFDRPKSPLKQIRGFLGLPGELRNRIYECYFEGGFRVELAAASAQLDYKEPTTFKFCPPHNLPPEKEATVLDHESQNVLTGSQTLRMPRKLGRYLRVDGERTKWSTSLCPLILVCKQSYNESIIFLYQNTTFLFHSPRRIQNFLNTVRKDNLQHIIRLHLHYSYYNEPTRTEHARFADKHLQSWNKACEALSKRLPNLQELEIWAKLYYLPGVFSLRQRGNCLKPLCQFRRLATETAKMRRVDAKGEPVSLKATIHYRLDAPDAPQWHFASKIMEMKALSEQAVAKAILGCSEEEAMKPLRSFWEELSDIDRRFLRWAEPVVGKPWCSTGPGFAHAY